MPLDHHAIERQPMSGLEPVKHLDSTFESVGFGEVIDLFGVEFVTVHIRQQFAASIAERYFINGDDFRFTQHALLAPIWFAYPHPQADAVAGLRHPFWSRTHRLAFHSRFHQRRKLRFEHADVA